MFKGFPNPFKKAVPAAAAAPSVKKNFGDFTRKYKISKNIKNYKPVNIGKRSSLFNRGGKLGRLNTIYALDNYENNKVEGDKAVDIAKKRYQKLRGTMPLSQDDSLEMNTLYYLLKKVGNVAGLPSPTGPNASVNTYNYGNDVLVTPNSPAAPAANAGDPSGPAAAPAAAPAANNAGDPTIEGTIQRMKCTVCESQKIISNALKNGKGPAKCDMCGAKAVVPIAAPSAANMFGSTNFSTNGSRNNANKGANAAAAAKVPTAANMFGSTNFSTNGSRNNANKGANAAATPATAAQEAENAANAAAAAVEAASNAAEHPNDRNAAAQAAAAAANAARANANARAAAAAAEAARAANAAAAPASAAAPAPSAAAPPAAPAPPASRAYNPFNNRPSVSYTHLTLPTIYSV